MAGDPLNPRPAAAGTEIATYLAALDRALPGPPRRRSEILDEIRDGLLAAADRRRSRGVPTAAAMRAACAEFGPPEVVAWSFAGELATEQARRLLWALLLTGPLVGMWWLLLLAPDRWPLHPGEVWAAIPVLPVIGATIAVTLAVLASTGRLAGRMPRLAPRHAVMAAQAVSIACLIVDIAMLARLAGMAIAAPGPHPRALMVTAAAATLARLPWVVRAAGRCHRSSLSLH